MDAGRRARDAMTLTEVLLALVLLAVALVPAFRVLTRGMVLARDIELRSRAVFLAQREIERVLSEAAGNFNQDFSLTSEDVGDGFLATVQDGAENSLSKSISVQVGWDADGDNGLDAAEVLVTLMMKAANTTEDVP